MTFTPHRITAMKKVPAKKQIMSRLVILFIAFTNPPLAPSVLIFIFCSCYVRTHLEAPYPMFHPSRLVKYRRSHQVLSLVVLLLLPMMQVHMIDSDCAFVCQHLQLRALKRLAPCCHQQHFHTQQEAL